MTSRLEGLNTLFLMTAVVCQLSSRWASVSKLAVFGHIPVICLKLTFSFWSRSISIELISFSKPFNCLLSSISTTLSRFSSLIFTFKSSILSRRRSLLASSFLTWSNSLFSWSSKLSFYLAARILCSIARVRRPEMWLLMWLTPTPVIPAPFLTTSSLRTAEDWFLTTGDCWLRPFFNFFVSWDSSGTVRVACCSRKNRFVAG